MGKVNRTRRRSVIAIKQKRRRKIQKLRLQYAKAKTDREKRATIERALKINPNLTSEEFLASIKTDKSSDS